MTVPTAKMLRDYLGEKYEESDEELIKLYLETHQFYRRLQKEVKNSELLYEHTNKFWATNMVKNPLTIEPTKTVQTLNNLLKSLGLTPAQRKKLRSGEGEDDFDSF